VAQAANDAEAKSTLWDTLGEMWQSLLPFNLNRGVTSAIAKRTGTDRGLDKYSALHDLRSFLNNLSPAEQSRVVVEVAKEVSSNPAIQAQFLSDLNNATRMTVGGEIAMDAMQAVDVGMLMHGLSRVLRKGVPLKAVRDVAGEGEAGRQAIIDLLGKTGFTGLNDAELVSRVIAGGVNPFEVDPAALRGLNAAAQKELRDGWEQMRQSMTERLNASGMTPDEIKEAAASIRASYAPETNPHVASVNFGEASADGQNLTVFWQSKDGRAFMSKEAAHAWAKEQGIVGYEVVPKNALEIQEQHLFHGGTVTKKFDDAFIGTGQGGDSLGQGFYLSSAEHLSEKYAAKYGHTLTKWEVPENNKFIHWYEGLAEQPDVVKKAATKLLGKDVADGMTGQDIYQAIGRKLGSEEAASAALRKEGVVGNYASKRGPHGTEPEHVLFSGKDAKLTGSRKVKAVEGKPVEEEPINIDGEIFYNKMQDPYDLSLGDVHDVLKLQEGQASAKGAFRRGEPLFQNGRKLEFGDQLSPKMQGLIQDWLKLLRLENKKLLVISERELTHFINRGDIPEEWLATLLETRKTSYGFYTQIPRLYGGVGGYDLIVYSSVGNATKRGLTGVLAHEIGHMFEKHALAHMPQVVRDDLHKAFNSWLAAHSRPNLSSAQFEVLFRVPNERTVRLWEAGKHAPLSADSFLKSADSSWYKDFNEFWSENFARWMLTADKPVSALDKWFAGIAEQLKKFFAHVADVVGVDVSKPNLAVKKLMDDYIANPIKWDSIIVDNKFNGWYKTGVNPEQSIKVAGKPHIKLKPTPTEEWLVKQTRNDPLSYASIGKFSKQDIDSMATVAVDPKHGASEQAVEARVVGVHAEAKTKQALENFIAPYYKGLGKDGTRRVQSLLEEGDSFSNAGSYGKEFTYEEATGRGLSDREAQAYLATRQLRMMMYHIRNGEMVRHLRAQGLKEIEIAGARTVGRDLSMVDASVLKNKQVYDLTAKEMVDWDSPTAAKLYGDGKRVVKLEHPQTIDGELRQLVLVDDAVKTRDITTALHYRPGEYSRIYTDEYFITMKQTVKVDGELKEMTSTIRTAKSVREASEFADNLSRAIAVLKNGGSDREVEHLVGNYFKVEDFKAAFANGDFEGATKFDYHFTRNKEEYLNGSVGEALANGRLFTSKRADRIYSVDAARTNTLGVFDSLEAEITNVSRVANINQWRESMVRRWMNTFGDMIPNRSGNDIADFYAATGATFTKASPEAVFAERTHKYIMRQIGLKTGEERYYQNMTRRMTEKWFTGNERIETIGSAIRQMGLLGFMRNVNFNLTLGMFNPAQLIVQANGAATAMVLSPLHGMAAAKTFPLLRMALMSDNPKVWSFLGTVEKGLLGSKDEFISLVRAVRQTGILDNLKSTSLYNLEDGKLNIFGGYPSKVFGHHAFFFDRGEEFSRLVSFDVARREWKAANKGMDWTTKEALNQIVVRMDDLTQNMTRANLARFQEGAASIPLQFAQYNIKLGANIMSSLLGHGGRSFTKTEALQLLAGHVVLYGAAGTGLAYMVDEMLPEDVKSKMSVAQKAYLGQGLLSGLLNQVGEWTTGKPLNIALGTRLGSFNYYQQLGEALFTDPKNIYDAIGGPTVGSVKRLGVIGDVVSLFMRDPDKSAKDIAYGLGRMSTEQVSTLRNAAKAYLYMQYQGKMIDAKGVAVAQLTPMEILGQALGFQPTAAVDVSSLIKSKKQHNEAMDDIASLVFKVQKEIVSARMRGDTQYADEQEQLLQTLWPENAGDFWDVKKRVRERLYPYDTEMQKLLSDYIMHGQTYNKPLTVTEQPSKE
jgi:hypothetical protein